MMSHDCGWCNLLRRRRHDRPRHWLPRIFRPSGHSNAHIGFQVIETPYGRSSCEICLASFSPDRRPLPNAFRRSQRNAWHTDPGCSVECSALRTYARAQHHRSPRETRPPNAAHSKACCLADPLFRNPAMAGPRNPWVNLSLNIDQKRRIKQHGWHGVPYDVRS